MLSGNSTNGTVEICGDDLLTIDVASPLAANVLAEQLRAGGEWCEVVAGIASVVVQFDATGMTADEARQQLADMLSQEMSPASLPEQLLEIPVVYGGESGPDFDAICQHTGLSAEKLIALHTGTDYRVDLVGFTPGFVYVGGLDAVLNMPRHSKPRQRVEAGSVGIADGRTGLYAVAGPGGWPIIGRTTYKLFDPDADNPFPISAGMRVRFVSISSPKAGL